MRPLYLVVGSRITYIRASDPNGCISYINHIYGERYSYRRLRPSMPHSRFRVMAMRRIHESSSINSRSIHSENAHFFFVLLTMIFPASFAFFFPPETIPFIFHIFFCFGRTREHPCTRSLKYTSLRAHPRTRTPLRTPSRAPVVCTSHTGSISYSLARFPVGSLSPALIMYGGRFRCQGCLFAFSYPWIYGSIILFVLYC